MPEVKICGITKIEDALAAAELGADATGFVFYRKSPRYVKPETARHIIGALPGTFASVGVFVNEDAHIVADTMEYCGLTMVQLHGDEPPEYARLFPLSTVIKAFSPSSKEDLDAALHYPCRAILIDTRLPGQYGGTGRQADWGLAARLSRERPIMIAGGLSAENVEASIRATSPCAIDVCSGIEAAPGVKDIDKMKIFIKAVRAVKESAGGIRPALFTAARTGS